MGDSDDFSKKYTQANVAKDAAKYDEALFGQWQTQLQKVLPNATSGLTSGILVAMLCAQGRGDAAGALFSDSVASNKAHVLELFAVIREALTLSMGFVGLPNVMPAIFGSVAELKKGNITDIQVNQRPTFKDANYEETGREVHQKIYRGVGNPEVAAMVAQYFPDLSYLATSSVFGYAIGGCEILPFRERELVVVSAIIALGASRQARSHCKAAIQLGNAPKVLEVLDEIAQNVARWNGRALPDRLNVPQLVVELNAELAKLNA
ncbi:hypothetical protein BKA64DRAFT_720949 [Cadophora sp. MPI-SDFR-AT-0126]|nr:hypothetical protein BKA64DRAFT_720949 [Leotiomycetes sp. MPI-SDFR-AT-0126]